MENNKPEYSKPEGCRAIAVVHGIDVTGNDEALTVVCGDRRTELKGVAWDDKTVLATEMILGFCVNCPNKASDEG